MLSSIRALLAVAGSARQRVTWAIGLLAIVGGVSPAALEAQRPTPEVSRIEAVNGAYLMRAPFPGGAVSDYLGAVFACAGDGSLDVATFFGGFPADRRPVQLAVRTADGRVHRFGPVVSGGPESGFHSPVVEDRAEALRFAAAALTPGALVSNGFRSFWNRAPQSDNAAALAYARNCRPTGR